MISIKQATEKDYPSIVRIGKMAVEESHRGSCSEEDMNAFLQRNYNREAITEELRDARNKYYILQYQDQPVGFSKIILNEGHPNIVTENVTKLDRIYLLKEWYGLKLGRALLDFNIELARTHHQSGIWLYTWTGNDRAIRFYRKAGFTIIGSHNYYVTHTHYGPTYQMFLHFQKPEVPEGVSASPG